jgi:pimeloyl-ACP methyl ester carboxylesterase
MDVFPGYVEVDGGSLYLERAGEGYPVVLIHGHLWDRRIWEPQLLPFAARQDVVRYDARGYGLSEPPTRAYSPLEDLGRVLEQLGIARCALVGLASGAALALDFALAHPDVAEAVVAVSPFVSGYVWEDRGIDVVNEEVRAVVNGGDLRAAMAIELGVWTPAESDSQTEALIHDVAMDNVRTLTMDPSLARSGPAAVDRLTDLQAGLMVIVGDEDVEEVPRIADLIESRVPGTQKRVIAGADHVVNVRKPEKFNQLVLDFLAFRM